MTHTMFSELSGPGSATFVPLLLPLCELRGLCFCHEKYHVFFLCLLTFFKDDDVEDSGEW